MTSKSHTSGAELTPEQILENLDPEQRQAAERLVGPVCILAGAGTGKTRTITHRIAYGIAKGVFTPTRVLALTYTNRAAGELRARLRAMGVPAVQVKTFHSAALSQIEFFWPQFAGVPAPQVIESKSRYITLAADTLKLQLDAAATRELASEIEWRKFSMLDLDAYRDVVETRGMVGGLSPAKNLELQQAYEQLKVRDQKIDWEDVLVLCLGLLRAEPRALEHVRAQYRFFTVDEYQDISPLQHALLDEWLGTRDDLCVVGDPNQTIYSFTGASSRFLRSFQTRFDDVEVVELVRNYRSTASIIQFANSAIRTQNSMSELQAAGSQSDADAQSVSSESNGATVRSFGSIEEEYGWLANEIRRKVAQGIPASQIAVLYRINGQSEAVESALGRLSVDYQVRGGERFFSKPEVLQALQHLRAEAISPSGRPTFQVLSDIVRSLGWQSQAPEAAGVARDRWETLNSLLGILEEVDPKISVADFVSELEERKRSQHEPTKAAVTLSTIHAAKGLEWDHVYVVGATEGYLPINYAKIDEQIAEEQRLFYVAVTRARKSLTISYSMQDAFGRVNQPSRFLVRPQD